MFPSCNELKHTAHTTLQNAANCIFMDDNNFDAVKNARLKESFQILYNWLTMGEREVSDFLEEIIFLYYE